MLIQLIGRLFINFQQLFQTKIKINQQKRKMLYEKKLIQIFKTFVEKVFIPQFRKFDIPITEWNKFSSMISLQNLNYSEIQYYVDCLPNISSLPPQYQRKQNSTLSLKKKEENMLEPASENLGFNPNKTFGGQRAKMAMFPINHDDLNEQNQRKQFTYSKEDSYKKNVLNNSQSILSGLQRLFKNLNQNQQKLEYLGNSSSSNGTNSGNQYKPYH